MTPPVTTVPYPAPVHTALAAARSAQRPARNTRAGDRARQLRTAADALDAAADTLIPVAQRETRLTEARLRGELARTTFQARLFADRLEQGAFLDARIDHADADWPMGPRPDIRRTHLPLGPVLVFAASNFPFAFSVFGGDTVSALAAGCPVVVKAHPGHPELSVLTARTVTEALTAAGAPQGLLSLVEGQEAGVAAVQDSRIKAVGFTGSTHGGRALFDLAARRPDPIPFYGELGSTNPVVVTPSGWRERGLEIAEGFADSYSLGSGQFCTQPGVVFVPDATDFAAAVPAVAPGPMLNERIHDAYRESLRELSSRPDVGTAARAEGRQDGPEAVLLRTDAQAVLADPSLISTEVFGPATLLVEYESLDEVVRVLDASGGSLTGSVHGGEAPDADALTLLDALAERVGRVLWNEWPTGVTVSDAQQHGGPWPATTAPTTTSVGTAAIHRFLRPVAYQNVPVAGLPAELRY
ncbi:aldehyde dehydrogenase (NADP(+)) [Streptomyces sulphureus]|uniref:aldehyde dehydrogenase (NADP(+)) n=1 Tax=Streptomyces sulphureus TaxID=47758 RepID=UPI00036760C1|nr:aldehyde dehydrogenase (NADP(+)) [Streptomyces sulphureus]